MTKSQCKECGGSQINHTLSYISSLFSTVCEPVGYAVSALVPTRLFELVMLTFLRVNVLAGLASTRTSALQADGWRARALWEEAERRNIQLTEVLFFGQSSDIFICKYKKDRRYFEGLPRPRQTSQNGLRWMDYKSKVKNHFVAEGIPVAHGGTAWTEGAALKMFAQMDKPVIVKPNDGSRSRHTHVHISDSRSLVEAFRSARQLGPLVMIEEELSGFVFRGTLIGKKLIAVCRRDPAHVIGDGVHSIKELVDIENNNPLRQGPIFQKIPIDLAEKELIRARKTWETIPPQGEYVTLGQKTSRAVGGGIADVTDVVHPDNKILLEKIAEIVDDPLIGVDFIMEDVARSWKEQPRSGVIECNSCPFIDLHQYPLVGRSQNVAGALWEIIYPGSRSQS